MESAISGYLTAHRPINEIGFHLDTVLKAFEPPSNPACVALNSAPYQRCQFRPGARSPSPVSLGLFLSGEPLIGDFKRREKKPDPPALRLSDAEAQE